MAATVLAACPGYPGWHGVPQIEKPRTMPRLLVIEYQCLMDTGAIISFLWCQLSADAPDRHLPCPSHLWEDFPDYMIWS